MKRSNIMRSVLMFILIVALLVPTALQANAIEFDGSSSGSGNVIISGEATTYGIYSTNTCSIIGYRFTGVNKNTGRKLGQSIDIYTCTNSSLNYAAYMKHNRCMPLYAKHEYSQAYINGAGETPLQWSCVQNFSRQIYFQVNSSDSGYNDYAAAESAGVKFITFDSTLPTPKKNQLSTLASLLNTWQNYGNNINTVANLIGYHGGTAAMGPGDIITIEPIYSVDINKERLGCTVSELAQLGGEMLQSDGYDSNGYKWSGSSSLSSWKNTWGAIADWTNRYWPNALYIEKGYPNLWNDNNYGISTGSNYRFKIILQRGYGVGVCYTNNEASVDLGLSSVDLYVGSTKYNAGTTFTTGTSVKLYYNISNGSSTTKAYDLYYNGTKVYSGTIAANTSTTVHAHTVTVSANTTVNGAIYLGGRTDANIESNTGNNTASTSFKAQSNFTLTVNPNGGSWNNSTSAQAFTLPVGGTKNIPAPTRTGYTFNGWTLSSNASSLSGTTFTMGAANCTLTANWTINSYYFDLNGYLDGATNGGISGFGTCDIYVNGSLWANDCADFYQLINHGSVVEIKDIKATAGHTYNGVYSGSIKVTMTGYASTYLNFTTNQHTITNYHYYWNPNTSDWSHFDTHTATQYYGTSYTPTQSSKIPTGSYLKTTYDYYNGSWGHLGTGTVGSTAITVNQNIIIQTFYYTYEYKLTVNPNGGTWDGHTSSQTYTMGYGKTKTINNPTRTGYTFAGWSKSNGNCSLSGTTYTQGWNDCTLTATWTPNKYVLDLNGILDGTSSGNITGYGTADVYVNGSRVANNVADFCQEIEYGSTWEITDIKTAAGKSYDGFSGVNSLSGTMGTSGINVALKFNTVYYSITNRHFIQNPNNGSWTQIDEHTATSTYGQNYTVSASSKVPTGYGTTGYFNVYTNNGSVDWNTIIASGNTPGSHTITSGIWIHTHYYPIEYTLTVNPNGGTWDGHTTAQGYTMPYSKTMTINNPTRTGYDFTGWSVSGGGTLSGTTYTQGTGNCTLTANWTPKTYTITLRAPYTADNGANWKWDLGEKTYTAKYGTKFNIQDHVNDITPPTGYHYGGASTDDWWEADNHSGTYTNNPNNGGSSTFTVTNNMIAQLHFYANTYTIKYHANGGSGSMSDQTATYDNKVTIKGNGFTRTGYTFAGWSTKSDNTDDGYNWTGWSGTWKYVDGQYGITNGVLNLYARWTPNTYTITLDKQSGSGGADKFYEIYDTKFYTDTSSKASVSQISVPTRKGYTFQGYYAKTGMGGQQIVDANGNIKVNNNYFAANTTIYAGWTIDYDVAITDITFRTSLDPNKDLTAAEMLKVPYGTTVYVYYTYANNSPVDIEVTGYNWDNGVINYQGSTAYSIAAWGTLTVPGGSFVADPIGDMTVSGSVYMKGYTNANHEEHWSEGKTYAQNNNTLSEKLRITFDIYVKDVYVTYNSPTGVKISSDELVPGETYFIHFVLGNDAYADVVANSYRNDTMLSHNGSTDITIPARGSIDIIAAQITPEAPGEIDLIASVFRPGMNATTERFETNLANNILSMQAESGGGGGGITGGGGSDPDPDREPITVIETPYVELIDANAAYRATTDVITSAWLKNPTNNDYATDNMISVRMRVYDASTGQMVTSRQMDTVVPANEDQLVYFKWTVPELTGVTNKHFQIIVDMKINYPDYLKDSWINVKTKDYAYTPWTVHYTTDTEYEAYAPGGWMKPVEPAATAPTANWYQWKYENGAFSKVNYGINVKPGTLTVTPDSKTAIQQGGNWSMKSGYGFFMTTTGAVIQSQSGYTVPGDAYTKAQYVYATYPEFSYSEAERDTLERTATNKWELHEFMDYGRKHHTPIWYPDGSYIAKVHMSDIWTPAGMLTVTAITDNLFIAGDMYDDWYITHK